jgi:hypothetical protein
MQMFVSKLVSAPFLSKDFIDTVFFVSFFLLHYSLQQMLYCGKKNIFVGTRHRGQKSDQQET